MMKQKPEKLEYETRIRQIENSCGSFVMKLYTLPDLVDGEISIEIDGRYIHQVKYNDDPEVFEAVKALFIVGEKRIREFDEACRTVAPCNGLSDLLNDIEDDIHSVFKSVRALLFKNVRVVS